MNPHCRARSPKRPRKPRPALSCALTALALLLAPTHGLPADPLETVAKSADEWVKLRIETTRLETAWQEEHALVESIVAALKEREKTAEEKRDLAKARTAREREELDALRAKVAAEGNDLKTFEARLKELTAKLIALRPALPPRLSEALELAFRSLANPALPAGERMQLAMSVLNRCAQFNRSITVGEDVLMPDGAAPAKSLPVIYWGLSHGYAIDRAAHQAWLGAPATGGWRWEAKPEAFDRVAQLLAIAADQADPDFVAVPATVSRALPEKTQD